MSWVFAWHHYPCSLVWLWGFHVPEMCPPGDSEVGNCLTHNSGFLSGHLIMRKTSKLKEILKILGKALVLTRELAQIESKPSGENWPQDLALSTPPIVSGFSLSSPEPLPPSSVSSETISFCFYMWLSVQTHEFIPSSRNLKLRAYVRDLPGGLYAAKPYRDPRLSLGGDVSDIRACGE